MLTVDQLLLKIINHTSPSIEDVIPKRDFRVLKSMASAVASPAFITENQSKLLLKIFRENTQKLESFDSDFIRLTSTPLWSKIFRQVDRVKKFFIGQTDSTKHLVIEFSFSAPIRKTIISGNSKISGLVQQANGRMYYADLTEKNIVELYDLLQPLGFEIDEKIEEFYKIVKNWSKIDYENQFKIDTITNTNFQKAITTDLGIETAIDQNIINDRSLRYQFFTEKTEKNPENLTEKIATRKSTKIWIDKKNFSLEQIFQSVFDLKRFPVLVVFDLYDSQKTLDDLKLLSETLNNFNITSDIGIYFRLNNDPVGKEFNQLVATHKYNDKLTASTKVVGVANGKIPKFLLKSDWKPMCILNIGKPVQNNKTAVYSNCCDLIISWTESEPILFSVGL